MPDEPYRTGAPQSPADAELAGLAAEGQRKIHAAAASGEESRATSAGQMRDEIIRAAIGAHFGSPVRNTGFALFGAVPLMIGGAVASSFAGGDLQTVLIAVFITLAVVSFVAAMILASLPPIATPARVEAERAWVGSLPFAMHRYFDLVGTDDVVAIHIVIDVAFASGLAPEASLVEGAAGVLDVDARAQRLHDGTIRLRGAALPNTFLDFAKRRENTNCQHVAYVHALVDRVLMPIHRSHPISGITLGCDTALSDDERGKIARLDFLIRKW